MLIHKQTLHIASIIETTDKHVSDLFTRNLSNTFTYHNYEHTKRVWESTKEIIENSEIDANESEILLLASLLYDIVYIEIREGHEEESVKMATEFLKSEKVDKETINAVNGCIMATKLGVEPTNTLEEIIKEADASHFGKKYFFEVSELLRKELELQDIKVYSEKGWRKENIKMLGKKHKFYTEYANKKWKKRKKKNLAEKLIKTTDLNISQIVYTIGLSSRSYFSKIFKEKYKCSPREYENNRVHMEVLAK